MGFRTERQIPTGKYPTYECLTCKELFESQKGSATRTPKYCTKLCFAKSFDTYVDDPSLKMCSKCRKIQPVETFSLKPSGNRSSECKPCVNARKQSDPHLKEKRRAYYEANRASILAKSKAYQQAHPEVLKKSSKKWAANNQERCRERVQRRRNRKRGNGGSYTAQEWQELCDRAWNRCLDCGRKKPLSVDHVIPVSKGGTSEISNLQPLCVPCNSRKRDKEIDFRSRLVYADMLQILCDVYSGVI